MKVFFSHAGRDKPLLREIQQHLPRHLKVWLDDSEIRAGQSIDGALFKAIRKDVDVLVLLVGPEAVQSEWVQKEFEWGRRRERESGRLFVLPVVLDEGSWEGMPIAFRGRRYLACTDFTEHGVRAFAARLSDELFAYASSHGTEPLSIEWALESQESRQRRDTARLKAAQIIAGKLATQEVPSALGTIVSALEPLDRLRLLCHYELVLGGHQESGIPDQALAVECVVGDLGPLEQVLDWSDGAHKTLREDLGLGDKKYLVHESVLRAIDALGPEQRSALFSGMLVTRLRRIR